MFSLVDMMVVNLVVNIPSVCPLRRRETTCFAKVLLPFIKLAGVNVCCVGGVLFYPAGSDARPYSGPRPWKFSIYRFDVRGRGKKGLKHSSYGNQGANRSREGEGEPVIYVTSDLSYDSQKRRDRVGGRRQ